MTKHVVVEEIDRILEILPDSLIGEYLKFDEVCNLLLDLRQLAAEPAPTPARSPSPPSLKEGG